MEAIDPNQTALVLIGFQNDYFNPEGILYSVVEESHRVSGTLANTRSVIDAYRETPMTMVNTPIVFSELYGEIENPVGILKIIRDVKAFKEGTFGAETIDEIKDYGDRIRELPGKKSFNAFSNTGLQDHLAEKGIKRLLFAGCVTSICVNATALHAFENGFAFTMLSACTSSRTPGEQEFFCDTVFPIFAEVGTGTEAVNAGLGSE